MVTNASDLPEGTVTVLLTDVVGSTALNRLGDEAARAIMRGCEEIVRAQLVAHRGTEVKGADSGRFRCLRCYLAVSRRRTEAREHRCHEPSNCGLT